MDKKKEAKEVKEPKAPEVPEAVPTTQVPPVNKDGFNVA